MQTAAPPIADEETPALPDEILRRLQEQYGNSAGQRRPSGLWTRFRNGINASHLALAACILLLGLVVSVFLRETDTPEIRFRGHDEQLPNVPAFWLDTSNANPPIKGLGLPKFTQVTSAAQIPVAGTNVVFDPVQGEIRLLRDGKPVAAVTVEEAGDPESWSTAHRQLMKLMRP